MKKSLPISSSPPSPARPVLEQALDAAQVRDLRAEVRAHYRRHGRSLPWRRTTDPYAIVVSEVMLQQTQVDRVIPKYEAFLARFPTVEALGHASSAQVLAAWQGLGYNRRALALKRFAEAVEEHFGGAIPQTVAELRTLPGIGAYTAAAVAVFAFGRPEIVIETNIRTVFLARVAGDRLNVSDREIASWVEQTLDRKNPRDWYHALMDFGSWLKRAERQTNRRSAHYRRAERFEGSNRQLRGRILKTLVERGATTKKSLCAAIGGDTDRFAAALAELERENLVHRTGRRMCLGSRE